VKGNRAKPKPDSLSGSLYHLDRARNRSIFVLWQRTKNVITLAGAPSRLSAVESERRVFVATTLLDRLFDKV
jgi:hypothetical protein